MCVCVMTEAKRAGDGVVNRGALFSFFVLPFLPSFVAGVRPSSCSSFASSAAASASATATAGWPPVSQSVSQSVGRDPRGCDCQSR